MKKTARSFDMGGTESILSPMERYTLYGVRENVDFSVTTVGDSEYM